MRVEGNEENFVFFINNDNQKYLFNSKEITTKSIKDIIIKLIRYYDLNIKGIYNINIYQNDKIGLIIEGEKKENYNFSNIIDLRLTVIKDYDFLLKCEDYFIVEKYKNKFYYDNNYYILLSDIDNILDVVEYVEIIYGNKREEVIENSIKL